MKSNNKKIVGIVTLILIITFCGIAKATPSSKYGPHISTDIDSEGFIHVVFSGYNYYNHKSIYVKINSISGKVVIPPVTLPSDGDGVYPEIAVDSQGEAHIIFHVGSPEPFQLKYIKLNRNGNVSFDHVLSGTFHYAISSTSPHICIDNQDRVYLLMHNRSSHEKYYNIYDNNFNLLHENTTEALAGYDILVDQTQFNYYIIQGNYSTQTFTWSTKSSIPYEYIETAGGERFLLRKSGWDYHEIGIIDSNGEVHFFFRADSMSSMEDNYKVHYQKVSSDGNIIISDNSFINNIEFPTNVNAVLDLNGDIHLILWGTEKRMGGDVFYMKLNENGNKYFSPYSLSEETGPSSSEINYYFIGLLFILGLIVIFLLKYRRGRSEQVGDGQRRSERLGEDEGKKGHSAD